MRTRWRSGRALGDASMARCLSSLTLVRVCVCVYVCTCMCVCFIDWCSAIVHVPWPLFHAVEAFAPPTTTPPAGHTASSAGLPLPTVWAAFAQWTTPLADTCTAVLRRSVQCDTEELVVSLPNCAPMPAACATPPHLVYPITHSEGFPCAPFTCGVCGDPTLAEEACRRHMQVLAQGAFASTGVLLSALLRGCRLHMARLAGGCLVDASGVAFEKDGKKPSRRARDLVAVTQAAGVVWASVARITGRIARVAATSPCVTCRVWRWDVRDLVSGG